MVHYKLTYFPVRGNAETARQLLSIAGQEFEDIRISPEEWATRKHEAPFGQVPVLEVDGEKLAQTYAINRYLAKKYGFAGKTCWEEAEVDSLADQWKDFSTEIRPFFLVWAGMAAGDKFDASIQDALRKDMFIPANQKVFGYFSKYLEKSKSGFLVGDSLTWVDILVAEYVSTVGSNAPELAHAFPQFIEHRDRVHNIPAIAKWIKSRPETPY